MVDAQWYLVPMVIVLLISTFLAVIVTVAWLLERIDDGRDVQSLARRACLCWASVLLSPLWPLTLPTFVLVLLFYLGRDALPSKDKE